MEDIRPRLQNMAAFQRLLADYHVSEHAQRVLDESRLVVMSGLAGGGRNTIINRLVEQYDYFFLVSDTTRPAKLRNGILEQDGVHYYFRNEADMLRDIQNGEFIEAEIIHNQQVSGTSIRELQRANETGKIAIHDFEYGGANNVAHAKADAHIIGLLPPSYEEWLRRFRDREVIHEQEYINRLHTAEKVLENIISQPYFKIVINDDIDRCVEFLRKVVEQGEYTPDDRAYGIELAQDMLDKVRVDLRAHHAANT